MTTKWAHLPNAKHIDRILESLKTNPDKWASVWKHNVAMDAAWDTARVAAWNAARDTARVAAWNAAWSAVRVAARVAAWNAAWDAIIALIAYDDCAYMLDSDPGELAILAKFGDPKAILLLPACDILSTIKEQNVTTG